MSGTASGSWEWIDDDDGLRRLAGVLQAAGELALDTESDGFHHYFDKLCLLQLSTRSANYVVDPLALTSLEPLKPVLEDPAVPTVLHAADQDLMYLRRDHGIEVRGLFDTFLGAQFLGHERLGLAALLEEYFGVKLSKSNQLDDWSRRPLTDAQLRYAIADTNRLLPLRDLLLVELTAKHRLDWADEECRVLERRSGAWERAEPDDITRVKGWTDLNPRGRAILRELMRVRDKEARRRDRPPFRIVGNAVLLTLAGTPPKSIKAVAEMKGFPRQRPGRLVETFFQAAQRGQRLPEAEFPEDPRRRGRRRLPPRDPAFDERVDALKAWRKKAAERLALPAGVVTPQRDLDALADAVPQSGADLDSIDGLRDWRKREFGAEWLPLLSAAQSSPA